MLGIQWRWPKVIKTCSCLHVNQLVTSCASDLSNYARPIDQLAAARIDHKDISMLHNSSTQKPSASICVQEFVAPWMLMRILYCWIKERISSTHRHLGVKPSEPNEEYYQENSHDEAFSITGVLLSVLAARMNSNTGFVLSTLCEATSPDGAWCWLEDSKEASYFDSKRGNWGWNQRQLCKFLEAFSAPDGRK